MLSPTSLNEGVYCPELARGFCPLTVSSQVAAKNAMQYARRHQKADGPQKVSVRTLSKITPAQAAMRREI